MTVYNTLKCDLVYARKQLPHDIAYILYKDLDIYRDVAGIRAWVVDNMGMILRDMAVGEYDPAGHAHYYLRETGATLRDARAGDVLDIAPILERLGIAPEPINYKEPYMIEELEIAGDTAVLFSATGGNWSLPADTPMDV